MESSPKDLVLDDRDLSEIPFSPVCTYCAHLTPESQRKCLAFRYIPEEIWNGTVTHREPYPDDNGIQFEFHHEVSESEKARLQERQTL